MTLDWVVSSSRTCCASMSAALVTRLIALSTFSRWSEVTCGSGDSKMSSHTRLSCCNAAEWNVAAVTSSPTPSVCSRARISAAAFTENVTASTLRAFQSPRAHA